MSLEATKSSVATEMQRLLREARACCTGPCKIRGLLFGLLFGRESTGVAALTAWTPGNLERAGTVPRRGDAVLMGFASVWRHKRATGSKFFAATPHRKFLRRTDRRSQLPSTRVTLYPTSCMKPSQDCKNLPKRLVRAHNIQLNSGGLLSPLFRVNRAGAFRTCVDHATKIWIAANRRSSNHRAVAQPVH